ncbi:MAG: hypothetical protein AB7E32_12130 [Desulfovibrio sp.]
MRSRFAMLAVALSLVAGFLLSAGLAHSQGKFANKDTAANRQDHSWGTRINEGRSYFGTDADENDVWGYQPAEPEKPVDWYDKIVITVNPETQWPSGGSTSSTTSTSTTSTDGADTTTSTTTTSTTAPNE